MKDLISVIVPVYKVEQYLRSCLDSLVKQTYKNIEVILVDDGSPDNSGVICDEFAQLDNRFLVIHKENGGLSDARNEGIKHATGQFVVFVDSDDFVSDNFVEYLYNLINENDADIGICDLLHCFPNQKNVFEKESFKATYSAEEAICEMLYQKSFLVAACGKIFPREYFSDIQFPYGIVFEDSAIMYRLLDRAKKVVYGNAKLYGYMHREDSITTKAFSERDLDIIKICDEISMYMSSRNEKLQAAARSYQLAAAFRVYMNAPKTKEFEQSRSECEKLLGDNAKRVLKDKQIRRKMRIALLMFLYAKPLMPFVYKKVNRWK